MRRLALIAAMFAACTVDPAANPGQRCAADPECGASRTCFRGFCVERGVVGDSGVDAPDLGVVDPGDGGRVDAGREPCDEAVTPTRPCYTGPAGTATTGECRAGFQACVDGFFADRCFTERVPGPEIPCTGRDEACNGDADEDPPEPCMTGRQGICAVGEYRCVAADRVCVQTRTATVEVCGNNLDDDCNGLADDIGVPCYDGPSGCRLVGGTYVCDGKCRPGVAACGEATCIGAVVPAMSDGCTSSTTGAALDDDCDGSVDEDCVCNPGETRPCYRGPGGTLGMGVCRTGTVTCQANVGFGACMGDVVPQAETCANLGRDDNCDGMMDNIPDLGAACTTTGQGICRSGVIGCVGGAQVCVTPAARDEICNGEDDDCDGMVDEDFDFTSTANCRRCGNRCDPGEICCGAGCVNPETDPQYCGSCTQNCGAGLQCCGGSCIDPNSDRNNCGGCGVAACGAGQECCGGACVAVQADDANCGGCGMPCTNGTSCCGGACHFPAEPECTGCAMTCGASEMCCAPVATVCANVMTDELHCGSCNPGSACTGSDLCCNGTCTPRSNTSCSDCGVGCPANSLCCNGACVPNGANNCNSCNNRCTGMTPNCCPTGCTNIATDEASCGVCGRGCTAPETQCCGGQCVNPLTDVNACGPNCERCPSVTIGLITLLGRCNNGVCGI